MARAAAPTLPGWLGATSTMRIAARTPGSPVIDAPRERVAAATGQRLQ